MVVKRTPRISMPQIAPPMVRMSGTDPVPIDGQTCDDTELSRASVTGVVASCQGSWRMHGLSAVVVGYRGHARVCHFNSILLGDDDGAVTQALDKLLAIGLQADRGQRIADKALDAVHRDREYSCQLQILRFALRSASSSPR